MNQDPSHQEASHPLGKLAGVTNFGPGWEDPAHQEPAQQVEVTCPICLNSFHCEDSPVEWHRVNNALCNPDGVNPRASLLQAAHWLRAGAPGRALATIEAALSQQK